MAYVNANGGTSHNRVSEWKLKQQMCDIGRRIWLRGFCAGNEGNHSYRLSGNRFLCTPTNTSKGVLSPEDICTVDGEGKQVAGKRKRTSEFALHLAIYKARPEVRAVIHSHPPHATAFAVAGVELPTCIHPEAEVFLGPVRTAKYVTPGDERLGESIAPFVGESNAILLGNHGAVCFGAELEQAYYRMEILDAYARILILAKQIGSVAPLSQDQMKELLELKGRFGMSDPRTAEMAQGVSCSSDFLSRVGGEVAEKGRMACEGGTVPAPQSAEVARAVAENLPPGQYSDEEIELLVQAITDQILAST